MKFLNTVLSLSVMVGVIVHSQSEAHASPLGIVPSRSAQKESEQRAKIHTILAQGKGNYIIDSTSPNPDQFAHFEGAHDFLVEGCLLGGTRTVFRVSGGAETGRIQNCHVKPSGFWGGLTDIPNSGENRETYSIESAK
jgi:hypothetical protein